MINDEIDSDQTDSSFNDISDDSEFTEEDEEFILSSKPESNL